MPKADASEVGKPSRTFLEIAIVLAVMAVVLVMLLSTYERAQARAWQALCERNERQIGQALQLYVSDNDFYWPVASTWRRGLRPYMGGQPGVLTCPTAPEGTGPTGTRGVGGYAYNSALTDARQDQGEERPVPDSVVLFPATTVSICEEAAGIVTASGPDPYQLNPKKRPARQERGWMRHAGGANYLFCDGHVQWYRSNAVAYGGGTQVNDGSHPTFALGGKP